MTRRRSLVRAQYGSFCFSPSIPPFQSCERGIARIGKSNFYRGINSGSNKLELFYVNAAGCMSERRALKTMLVFVAVSVARIFLRIQPLKVLSGEFRRRPTSLVIKFRKSDRVGRRGLSEPREDFSRLPANAWTQKWFVQILAAD